MLDKILFLVPLLILSVEASDKELTFSSNENKLEVGISGEYCWEGKDSDKLANALGFGVNVGYEVFDSWSVLARYKHWSGVKEGNLETDISRYLLGLRYDFSLDKKATPYILGALGYEDYSSSYVIHKDGNIYNIGLGYRRFISYRSSFFAEATYRNNYSVSDIKDSGAIFTAGVNFHF